MDYKDLTKYLDMAKRRKWWIIIPFLATLVAGLAYYLTAPKVYKADTLILVIPQKVPRNYVRSIVSVSMEDRLRTITQQVTSRTNLEKIISQFKLFTGEKNANLLIDDKVALLRKRISTSVIRAGRTGGGAFKISFEGTDPEKVAKVTNALASNFITQNLKIRESQAFGTTEFLAGELEKVRRRLSEKEEKLRQYRQKYMGSLPEDLQTNLSVLNRLQAQLDQLNSSLQEAENRKLVIQQQIAQARSMMEQMAQAGGQGTLLGVGPEQETPDQTESPELADLKKQLTMLETRYTENHPDVVRLKAAIARLEKIEKEKREKAEKEQAQAEASAGEAEPKAEESGSQLVALPGTVDSLTPQLEQVNLEIKEFRAKIKAVQRKIAVYQRRVEETPKRQEELLSLTRDYDNLKSQYDSLLQRKLEAEIALSMEEKQKGEQFKVIDPAKVPERPIKPDMRKIMLFTVALGLLLGCGLAYLVEIRDTSYKRPEEVEEHLSIPVLLSLPIRYTERELRLIRLKKYLAYSGVTLGFLGSVFGVLVATKGFDKTIQFFTQFLTRAGG